MTEMTVGTTSDLNLSRGFSALGHGTSNHAANSGHDPRSEVDPQSALSVKAVTTSVEQNTQVTGYPSGELTLPATGTSRANSLATGEGGFASAITVTNRWEGSVQAVQDDFFQVRLTPLSGVGPALIADIYTADVADDDLALLRVGATLYLIAGHIKLPGGRKMQTSSVHFRRLGRWRADEIADLEARAQKRRVALGFDEDSS
jgi:hypothetical protein